MDLTDYKRAVVESPKGAKCFCCERRFGSAFNVSEWGPHGGGWKVEGFNERRWLYVHCRYCDYDTQLGWYGISRHIGD